MPKMPKMPIDVMAVLQEATDVEAARSVPLCVSVLLDDTAPDDLTAFVRSSFASASPQARVSVNYFEDAHIAFDARSDMAVIAAGFTPEIGEIVSRLHGEGIPVMVVTTLPECVNGAAEAAGHPIDAADVIAPNPEIDGVVTLHEPLVVTKEGAISGREVDPEDPFSLEPLPMCAAYHEQLRTKMGEWVVAAFREKRLAFAQAFDFVRKPLSMESVRSTAFQNAGIGLVIFIPGADFPIMTLNQTKMVIQIAAAYGQPLSADRVKELAAVVGGGLACRTVARQVAGLVPAVGWAVKAGVGHGPGCRRVFRARRQYGRRRRRGRRGARCGISRCRRDGCRTSGKGLCSIAWTSSEKCCHRPRSCRRCAGAWRGRRSHACRCECRSVCRAGCGHWCCPSGRCCRCCGSFGARLRIIRRAFVLVGGRASFLYLPSLSST